MEPRGQGDSWRRPQGDAVAARWAQWVGAGGTEECRASRCRAGPCHPISRWPPPNLTPLPGGWSPRVAALQSPPAPSKGNRPGWHRAALPTHGSSSGGSKQPLVFKTQREQVWSRGTVVQTARQREQALGATHKFTVDNNLRQTELFIVHRCFISPHLLNSVHKIMPNTFKKYSQEFPSFLPFHMGLVLRCSAQAETVHHGREYMKFFISLALKVFLQGTNLG